jgi:hypothetical protein
MAIFFELIKTAQRYMCSRVRSMGKIPFYTGKYTLSLPCFIKNSNGQIDAIAVCGK